MSLTPATSELKRDNDSFVFWPSLKISEDDYKKLRKVFTAKELREQARLVAQNAIRAWASDVVVVKGPCAYCGGKGEILIQGSWLRCDCATLNKIGAL